MMHPKAELVLIDESTGRGLRAAERIPRGTIVWARDKLDLTLTPTQFEALEADYREILRTWAYLDNQGDYVLCWDHGRYVNHSCDANVFNPGFEFEIAVRDIEPGEQLTNDYSCLNLEYVFECACGTPRCRGTVQASDLTRLAGLFDQRVSEAFRCLHDVPQPLWKYVQDQAGAEQAWRALRRQPPTDLRPYRRQADAVARGLRLAAEKDLARGR